MAFDFDNAINSMLHSFSTVDLLTPFIVVLPVVAERIWYWGPTVFFNIKARYIEIVS